MIPSVESIPTALKPTPYRPLANESAPPAVKKLTMIEIAIIITGIAVESIPSEIPSIIIVAEPVSDEPASFFVGLYVSDV